jgi:dipeptidyl aminopeptidase/acylaminoacyl peptidase
MRAVLLISASALIMASVAAAAGPAPQTAEQIAVATTTGRIVLVSTTGHRIATLTARAGAMDWAPAWSPDGKWLAFARSTDGRRSFHVYVMRANGSGVRQLTRGHFEESPAWSPDGRWIAYASEGGIRIVHPNGRGSRLVPGTGVTTPQHSMPYAALPSWTPRGRLSYAFHPEVRQDWPASCRSTGARCGWVVVSDRDAGTAVPYYAGATRTGHPTPARSSSPRRTAESRSSPAAGGTSSGTGTWPTGHPTAPGSFTPGWD